MKTTSINGWAVPTGVILVLALVISAYVVSADAVPRYTMKDTGDPWLSHFLGNEVVVTFAVAPLEMDRSVIARLMGAENAGIVLEFGTSEIFFSYGNIISVEPLEQ